MRKLSESKLKELKAEGVKVFAEGRRVVVGMQAPVKKEPAPVAPPKFVDPQPAVLDLIRVQAETANLISQYGEAVASCVAELLKPKPKKAWTCSVARGANGLISGVDIKEV